MVTMYFIMIMSATQQNIVLPHELPLFASKDKCEVVAEEMEDFINNWGSQAKCFPIEVKK